MYNLFNMIKCLEEIKNKTQEMKKGVPIGAVLWDLEKKEMVTPVFINKPVKKGTSKNKRYKTHAEYLLLESLSGQKLKGEFNLIVSSYPCEYCMRKIKENSKFIKNVLYISPISAEYKRTKFNILFKNENAIIKNKLFGMKTNIVNFNPKGEKDLILLSDEIKRIVSDYLMFTYIGNWYKINFIDRFEDRKNVRISKSEVKKNRSYINEIEKRFKTRFYTDEKKYVKFDLNKMRKIFNDHLKDKIRELYPDVLESIEKKKFKKIKNH